MRHRYDHFCSCGRCKSDRAAQRHARFARAAQREPATGADIKVPPDPFESLKSAEAAEKAKAAARVPKP